MSVYGDGRCLFRSYVIHGHQASQKVNRNPLTNMPLDERRFKLEEHLSDVTRKEVVEAREKESLEIAHLASSVPFMLENYGSFAERLKVMRNPYEYAGFLECVALSYISGRQVLIYEDRKDYYKLLAKFPNSSVRHSEAIHLLYKMETAGHDGHFDLILLHGNASDDRNVSC